MRDSEKEMLRLLRSICEGLSKLSDEDKVRMLPLVRELEEKVPVFFCSG